MLPKLFYVNWFRKDPTTGASCGRASARTRACSSGSSGAATAPPRPPTPRSAACRRRARSTPTASTRATTTSRSCCRSTRTSGCARSSRSASSTTQFGDQLPRELRAQLDALEKRLQSALQSLTCVSSASGDRRARRCGRRHGVPRTADRLAGRAPRARQQAGSCGLRRLQRGFAVVERMAYTPCRAAGARGRRQAPSAAADADARALGRRDHGRRARRARGAARVLDGGAVERSAGARDRPRDAYRGGVPSGDASSGPARTRARRARAAGPPPRRGHRRTAPRASARDRRAAPRADVTAPGAAHQRHGACTRGCRCGGCRRLAGREVRDGRPRAVDVPGRRAACA